MKTKRGCGLGAAVLAVFAALIVVAVVAGVLIYRRQRGAALATAPTVYVTDPVDLPRWHPHGGGGDGRRGDPGGAC